MQRTRLFVTRGLPGSGKTTVARETVQSLTTFEDGKPVAIKMVRINRDDFRKMFNGRRLGLGRQEQLVTLAQDASILAVLAAGCDVIVDDTNLRDADIRRFQKLVEQVGAELHVIDMRALVSLEECIRRDSLRPEGACVGEANIRRMHADHIAKKGITTVVLPAVESARATR